MAALGQYDEFGTTKKNKHESQMGTKFWKFSEGN
jgi:hypothetical protein